MADASAAHRPAAAPDGGAGGHAEGVTDGFGDRVMVTPDPARRAETTAAPDPSRPLGELVGELTQDMSKLVRQEFDLAKAELRQEAVKTGKAAGLLGGSGLAGYLAVLFVSVAAVWGLSEVMPRGWAALIVAAFWAIVAAALFAAGRTRLRSVDPTPHQTVETIKEDIQWAKTRNP
jgi:Putative Actinobacterial Holin-X, holin superfamily III